MTTKLDEFAINLPMAGVKTAGDAAVIPSPSYGYHDITADVAVPAEVSPASYSHIGVYVDSATATNYDATSPMVTVDLVLNVSITNPESGAQSAYKVVKRLSMDKVKLALAAEVETPYQVVEAETPEMKAHKLAEEQKAERAVQAASRARELAGLPVLKETLKTGDKVRVKDSNNVGVIVRSAGVGHWIIKFGDAEVRALKSQTTAAEK